MVGSEPNRDDQADLRQVEGGARLPAVFARRDVLDASGVATVGMIRCADPSGCNPLQETFWGRSRDISSANREDYRENSSERKAGLGISECYPERLRAQIATCQSNRPVMISPPQPTRRVRAVTKWRGGSY